MAQTRKNVTIPIEYLDTLYDAAEKAFLNQSSSDDWCGKVYPCIMEIINYEGVNLFEGDRRGFIYPSFSYYLIRNEVEVGKNGEWVEYEYRDDPYNYIMKFMEDNGMLDEKGQWNSASGLDDESLPAFLNELKEKGWFDPEKKVTQDHYLRICLHNFGLKTTIDKIKKARTSNHNSSTNPRKNLPEYSHALFN